MVTTGDKLPRILNQLRAANVRAKLRHDRAGAISVDAAVPGQRWEIDVLDDGSVEVEVFASDGTIHGESKLGELLERYRD